MTGNDEVPVEIRNGLTRKRPDMTTSHEEADNIIMQQTVFVQRENPSGGICVIADDTDVFLLLLHHLFSQKMSSVFIMKSPVHGRSSTDIRATVQKHGEIVPHLLAAHALSGTDTTAASFGIGKTKVLKVLAMGTNLSSVGDKDADMVDFVKQATQFIAACYGQKKCNTMSEARQKAWTEKTSKSRKCKPPLKSLSPTPEALIENVKRAHLRTLCNNCGLNVITNNISFSN